MQNGQWRFQTDLNRWSIKFKPFFPPRYMNEALWNHLYICAFFQELIYSTMLTLSGCFWYFHRKFLPNFLSNSSLKVFLYYLPSTRKLPSRMKNVLWKGSICPVVGVQLWGGLGKGREAMLCCLKVEERTESLAGPKKKSITVGPKAKRKKDVAT